MIIAALISPCLNARLMLTHIVSLSLTLGTDTRLPPLGQSRHCSTDRNLIKQSATSGKGVYRFTEFKQPKQSIGFQLLDAFLIMCCIGCSVVADCLSVF